MRETVFLIILLAGLNKLASSVLHQYHLVNQPMTWFEAQSYCRETYTDLATVSDQSDYQSINGVLYSISLSSKQAWIGLKYDSWRWSLEETETENGWPGGYPWNQSDFSTNTVELQECVYQSDGSWFVGSCNSNYYFVCYDGRQNATQTFVLVEELKTWYEAQSYCREKYTDLAIVRNQTDNQAFINQAQNAGVYNKLLWIGLYRNGTLSDGGKSNVAITTNIPLNTVQLNQSCATGLSISYTQNITNFYKFNNELENCQNLFPVVCYSEICKVSPNITHQYHLVNQQMTWSEAQSYCRETYTDLATVSDSEEYDSLTCLINSTLGYSGQAWIGLKLTLTWSLEDNVQYAGNEAEGIINGWPGGYPWYSFRDIYITRQMYCVFIDQNGLWELSSCDSNYYFVCYDGSQNATQTFVLVNEYKTWYEAQTYCRTNYTDLAIVRNRKDNEAIINLTQEQSSVVSYYPIWIGLYFDGIWSDNSTNNYIINGLNPSCATANYQNLYYQYNSENCNNTFAFVCYGGELISCSPH
ncbi:hypothetical protein UPYG_G00129730 [Umbra pygmaea]|uniref:C-type lectin domain-containing protein n=1 Tax=Umbra pygmaea TaxID=75934 RepID=A0ABD0XRU4_UMBPY